jgi:hypothetical protein
MQAVQLVAVCFPVAGDVTTTALFCFIASFLHACQRERERESYTKAYIIESRANDDDDDDDDDGHVLHCCTDTIRASLS